MKTTTLLVPVVVVVCVLLGVTTAQERKAPLKHALAMNQTVTTQTPSPADNQPSKPTKTKNQPNETATTEENRTTNIDKQKKKGAENEKQTQTSTENGRKTGTENGAWETMLNNNKAEELDVELVLRTKLLENYDKDVRPSAHNLTVVIDSLEITDFQVDKSEHSIMMSGCLQMVWQDFRLKWALGDHWDVDRLGVDPQEIWTPDLALTMTHPDVSSKTFLSQIPTLIYPNGDISVTPSVALQLSCQEDLTFWPHDDLNCSVVIGSWLHQGHMLNLSLGDDVVQFNPNLLSDWVMREGHISLLEQQHPCCIEPRVFLSLSIILHRNAPAFGWIKMPVICVTLLSCMVMLLPPGSGVKVVLGCSCLALHLFYLAVLSFLLPPSHHTTPIIVNLMVQQVVLMVVMMVVSVVLVLRIARPPYSSSLPSCLKSASITLSPLLCLSTYSRQVKAQRQGYAIMLKCEDEECESSEGGHSEYQYQWLLLAAILDRFTLVVYLLACVVTIVRVASVL